MKYIKKSTLSNILKENNLIYSNGNYLIEQNKITLPITPISKLYSRADLALIKPVFKTGPDGELIISKKILTKGIIDFSKEFDEQNIGVLNSSNIYGSNDSFTGILDSETFLKLASDLNFKQNDLEGLKFYQVNKDCRSLKYTDSILLSDVSFFRNENFELMTKIITCKVISCSPIFKNAASFRKEDMSNYYNELKNRMRNILNVFIENNCLAIVLCNFGCELGNEAVDIASIWMELLYKEKYLKQFEKVGIYLGVENNINR